MNLLQLQNSIEDLMTAFVLRVRSAAALGKTDINKVSETILIPLFREVYGYTNLKNLNNTEGDNYPGIDLGDEIARVALQITSTSSSKKVKETLRKFVDYEFYKKYDKLIIYILTEKQNSYSGKGYKEIIQGKFNFDKDADIIDYRDILSEIRNFQSDRARKVESLLKENFGYLTQGMELTNLIDWHNLWQQICCEVLENQNQWLTTYALGSGSKRVSDMYVPLGLVERKQPSRPEPNISPEQGSEFYQEKITPIEHKDFFEQVLKLGNSPKSNGRRIAIIGEPGAGKTTLLQKIASEVDGLPIWVDLADPDLKREENLKGYLVNKWLEEALPYIRKHLPDAVTPPLEVTQEVKDAFKQEFHQGRVWLLLDGADEIAAEFGNPLTWISRQIRGGWISEARVVLTCRLNVWEADRNALDANFDVYRNLDFSYPEQVEEFIDKWFAKESEQESGDNLKAQLNKAGERIKNLVKNPLRLMLLCRTWEVGGKLPDTKAGLYQRLVKGLYQLKDDNPEFEISPEEQEELNRKLGELARQAIDGKDSRFRLRESFIKIFLGHLEQNGSLFWIARKLGWLNQVGLPMVEEKDFDEKVYAFFHPTFQEYFAACAIPDWDFFLPRSHIDKPVTDKDNPDRYKRYRIFEPQWKEVFLLWLGRKDVAKEKKEAFVEALLKFEDGCGKFYEFRANFIAAAGIEEFRECNRADEIVEQLVKWGFGLFKLKQQKWQKFFEPIDENARAALGESDRSRAIDPLIHLLRTSQDTTSRECCGQVVRTIGEIALGSQDAINVLIELLHNSQDKYLCRQAFTSLAKIALGNRYAIDTLAHLLNTTKDEETLSHAAFCLGKIHPGNLTAITTLIDLLCNPEERLSVATASTPPQTNQKDFALEWEQIRKWSTAANHLEEIAFGNQDVIKALSDLLQTTEDPEICRRIGATLEKIDPGNQDAIKTLTNLLHNSLDETVRWRTILKLGEIKTGDSIKALTEVLFTSQKETEIWRAAESLGQIDPGNSDAINALIQLLKTSQDEYTLRVAPSVLGQISAGNQEALDCLIELLHNSRDEFNRQQYATILLAIEPNNPYAINTLIELLSITHDQFILEHSALFLRVINPGNSDAIHALKNALGKSKYEATRMNVAYILGRLDPENAEASTHLMDIACNSQDGWSNFAFYRLKEILPSRLFPVIVAQLKNCFAPLDQITKNNLTCDFSRWSPRYAILWHCAQNMSYPDFYQAWYSQPTSTHPESPDDIPVGNSPEAQTLEFQNLDFNKLQPTEHTYPLVINLLSFKEETEQGAIAQKLCNKIYKHQAVKIPGKPPTVKSDAELQQHLFEIQDKLQRPNLAFVLYIKDANGFHKPTEEAIAFCQKLTDPDLGIHIAWITNQPLEQPLKPIQPDPPKLISKIQGWIDEIV
jgi:HEAT repeat protein